MTIFLDTLWGIVKGPEKYNDVLLKLIERKRAHNWPKTTIGMNPNPKSKTDPLFDKH